jgi:hypothetical protein
MVTIREDLPHTQTPSNISKRFFAPDQQTPGQRNEPWRVGDVFSFVHGPNVRNVYAFRVLQVEPDGAFWKGADATEIVDQSEISVELDVFWSRVGGLS